jgi:5-oxoprolinase (ATP-hydrolysing)
VHEEGVLIDNELLVDAGRFREAELRALLGSGAGRRAIPTATSPI